MNNRILITITIVAVAYSGILTFLSYRKDAYIQRQAIIFRQKVQTAKTQQQIMGDTNLFILEVTRPLVDFFQAHAGYAIGG